MIILMSATLGKQSDQIVLIGLTLSKIREGGKACGDTFRLVVFLLLNVMQVVNFFYSIISSMIFMKSSPTILDMLNNSLQSLILIELTAMMSSFPISLFKKMYPKHNNETFLQFEYDQQILYFSNICLMPIIVQVIANFILMRISMRALVTFAFFGDTDGKYITPTLDNFLWILVELTLFVFFHFVIVRKKPN